MPYNRNSDLPAAVRDRLPSPAREISLGTFNNAWTSYRGRDLEERESRALRIARPAVKRFYQKANGGWQPRNRRSGSNEHRGVVRDEMMLRDLSPARRDARGSASGRRSPGAADIASKTSAWRSRRSTKRADMAPPRSLPCPTWCVSFSSTIPVEIDRSIHELGERCDTRMAQSFDTSLRRRGASHVS
jgi:cation transport regulator